MRVMLNRHEQLICEVMGTVRRKNAMQFNSDHQVSKQNPYDMDIDGFTGEFVVAKHLNVMVDTTINEKKNPIDLIWNQKTIDVKSSRNPNVDMHVTEFHKKSPCDLYIQVVLHEGYADLIGWIDGKTLFEKATLKTHSVRSSYVLPQEELFAMEDLK